MSGRGRGFHQQPSLRLPRSLLRVPLLNLQFHYEQLLRRLRRQEPRRTGGTQTLSFCFQFGETERKATRHQDTKRKARKTTHEQKTKKNSQDNWHFKPLKDTKRPARTAEQSRQDQKPGELNDKAPTSTDHQKIRPGQVTVRKPSSFWIWLFSTMPLGQFEHFFKYLFPYLNR